MGGNQRPASYCAPLGLVFLSHIINIIIIVFHFPIKLFFFQPRSFTFDSLPYSTGVRVERGVEQAAA